ncbi:hypothetical protein F4776DRAFT_330154 [Hypoxylon sp. NC0597]|nr:hypothetical protein F4776DRAFT_330154 [Hypoxylon sp. NC0597]
MSGFEIAGVVLGAFPLAIEALEKHREVFRRVGLFYKIRVEYIKCEHNLKFHRASFTGHLRRLLLPLIEDDDKIKDLLSNPGGTFWKDQETIDLLQRRLGEESYGLFIDCIEGVKEVMGKLNSELVLDSSTLQESLRKPKPTTPGTRLKESATKANMQFQMYKLKFSNGETVRTALFKELEHYDAQLTRLLDMNDKETELAKKRPLATNSSSSDTALCNFWIHANALFKALASAWTCCCQDKHLAELLLQHRTNKKKEFNMLFAKHNSSRWHIQKALITERDGNGIQMAPARNPIITSVAIHQPLHRTNAPRRPALRASNPNTQSPRSPVRVSHTIALSDTVSDNDNPILSLCTSLDQVGDDCCGYLTEEDCRYYVYRVSQQQTENFDSVTIDQILRREVSPPPSRRQRYALSFILASSFLQLLNTPWLPESWRKSDIVFISDEKNPSVFLLDQPHLKRDFMVSSTPQDDQQSPSSPPTTINQNRGAKTFRSLELLGIVLLELCFGQLLEDQPCRKRWPSGDDETQKYAFDFVAARQWNDEVNEEAGPDFDEAIRWCFEGHRNTPPENWRQEMLRHVVQPIERCHRYLSEGR